MNLNELLKKIEKRPGMFFVDENIKDLKNYLSGFLMSRSYCDDFSYYEKSFRFDFSNFVAGKLSLDEGESWDRLLENQDDSWSLFFRYYKEFIKSTEVIKLIESGNIESFKTWLNEVDIDSQILPENFNWYTIAEKLSAQAFNFENCNEHVAQLSIGIYERIYKLQGDEGAFLSSLYIRLRVLKLVKNNATQTLHSKDLLALVKSKLEVNISDVKNLAENWKSLEVEKIKELRNLKNWIKVIEDLEVITEQVYEEFEGWKDLKVLLP
jgi:hypothetical protein